MLKYSHRLASLLAFLLITLTCQAGWDEARLEQEEAMLLTPDITNGKLIYEGCAVCHMPEGWVMPSGAYPQIAGQHRSVTIKQLADIRGNNRDNPSMFPYAIPEEIGGVQSIADVAAYIEQLKMTNATGKGSGSDIEHGGNLYHKHCADCHGDNGEGDPNKAYPRIQSQHYNYLVRQLQWIQNGKRRNANSKMVEHIKDLQTNDLEAIADYISRMSPDNTKLSPYTWQNRH